MQKKTISSKEQYEWKIGGKYPDDLILPQRFGSVHLVNTLLSHEATGEELWMAVMLVGHGTVIAWLDVLYPYLYDVEHAFWTVTKYVLNQM